MPVEGLKTPKDSDVFGSNQDMHEDITGLSRDQLDYYVRLSFLDSGDLNFLPRAFWSEVYQGAHGRGDGHMAEGAAEFFGNLYGFVGRIHFEFPQSDDASERSWIGYPVHVEYRERFRSVLATIMDESLNAFPPSDEQKVFAVCSVIAVSRMAIAEINAVGYPFGESQQYLYKKAREITRDKRFTSALQQIEPIKLSYITNLFDRAILPDEPHPSAWNPR